MTPSQRARYLKTGGILAFIVLLLFLLTPSEKRGFSNIAGGYSGGQTAIDPTISTDKCTKSYHPSKPLIQYALMIDAGSTGSRIHVYRFNNCGPTPELENEIFKMTEPKAGGAGLSSYKADAEGAAMSLDPLLEVAMHTVPDKLKPCSPIAVKATAGLRLLGPEMSSKILAAVRTRLETVYPFPVVADEKGGVQIMDGKDEGVYAWITTNYLLGKIGGPDETPTAAVFDLGGGSTQIVFQPTFKSPSGGMPDTLAEGDHKYNLSFGGRDFTLYQHSHLGYGLMSAREAMHKIVLDAQLEEHPTDHTWLGEPIINPCVASGMSREVEVKLGESNPLGASIKVNMTGPPEGSPAQCRGVAEKILKKDAECKLAPCSFNGVHQPSLDKTFSREDVYIFSYFFDRTQPLGMPESFTLKELKDLTAKVCEGESGWGIFGSVEGALAELKDRPEWCMDLNFMFTLLHTGYEMPMDREVRIAKKIKGNELGWCLGASLPLLSQESGWKCRIKEIS
ncbi:nucleoside diphosphatase Gda1 [Xylona heveae TC161]|uniref:guanosine-diphosphatase n=1 Tax=Xylona heveae (strain CBS 132557 / TC161) TaxID=1328760 RepID=A0A165JTY0_XYLHT|nr:nucleoside diphosphatase Gda1 [Xylona heveae TC161]KZF26624.1 nucleoside diphosphatase Gda1 [Xylona heveae TC161]